MRNILGIDIGGVIIDRQNDSTDTSFFGPNYLLTTAVPGVFDAIKSLVDRGYQVHLVSKCGSNVERKTREWLKHHRFFERTGVDPARLHFCRTRPEKGPICRALGVTHFVDDRLDVLDCLDSVGEVFLFQPNRDDAQRHGRGHRARRFDRWEDLVKRIQNPVAT